MWVCIWVYCSVPLACVFVPLPVLRCLDYWIYIIRLAAGKVSPLTLSFSVKLFHLVYSLSLSTQILE